MKFEKIFSKNEPKIDNEVEAKKNYWENWEPKLNERLFVKRSNGDIEGDWSVSEIFDETEGKMIMATKPDIENPEITLRKSLSQEELAKINDKQNLDYTEAADFKISTGWSIIRRACAIIARIFYRKS